jgi:hypothetical protein
MDWRWGMKDCGWIHKFKNYDYKVAVII